jgi:predicted adenine nucleotide alpha hydrolase (AANH) superfamily ATPase
MLTFSFKNVKIVGIMTVKQKILLHICCAPCGVAVIDELVADYAVTAYFYNPNIYPQEECEKRLNEVKRICAEYGVDLIVADYEADLWNKETESLVNEPEGGKRCKVCVKFRLKKAAKFARENGFDIFATTLSSGRQKNSEMINSIGNEVAREEDINFLSEDWKKGGRQEKSSRLIAEKKIYRQNYCGCKYSLRQS